jgi:hypothetical protein
MKLKSWFKSSQDISLLAFECVVSKMNFYIFLTTFIGIIVSLKAKYFSYAESQWADPPNFLLQSSSTFCALPIAKTRA